MKRLYVARDLIEAHLVRTLLEAEGCRSTVREDDPWGARTEVGGFEHTWPTVWLLDEAQEAEAGAVVNLYRSGAGAETCGAQEWRCPRCCELVEPQFGACWRCGERQPA